MATSLLRCVEVSKRYASLTALERVSIALQPGELVCLVGPNGAGKTTLLKCLVRLATPTDGTIWFQDRPLREHDVHQRMGFLPEAFQPPGTLTARELLRQLARALRVRTLPVQTCLEEVGLGRQADQPLRTYSRGMLQRLGLAVAFLKDPELLILDEPTLGLDPQGQAQLAAVLARLNAQGKTVLFSSHLLLQVERLCHRVGLMHRGRLIFWGGVEELRGKHRGVSLEEAFLRELEAAEQPP